VAKDEKASKKLLLKLKLKAWWNGYDAEEVEKRYLKGLPKTESTQKSKAKPPVTVDPTSPFAIKPWDKESLDIAQFIWGKGYCGPGGPEYIVALSKLLAMSPEMSMVDVGCNIGGASRTLAERFGIWVTGLEENAEMAEVGQELSKMAGMEKKAQIQSVDFNELEAFDRKYDRAIARESLFNIEDKKKVLTATEEALKPGGLMLVTDYVLGDEGVVMRDSFKEWKVGERSTPYCVMPVDYEEMFKDLKMQVRVSEDISKEYITLINRAWAGAEKVAAKLAKEEDGPHKIQILMREAEFWTRRKKMLSSGELRLWRIVANKKAGTPSMMSDW